MDRRPIARSAVAALALALLTGCGGSADDRDDADRGDPAAGDTAAGDAGTDGAGSASASEVPSPRSSVLERAQTARPSPVDVPSAVDQAASDAASGFADAIVEALVDPGGGMSALVAGAARDALVAQAAEYRQSGLHLRGRPRVLSVEVYDSTDDQIVIGACIDDSRVRVVDRRGHVVSGSADRPPTLNLLTAVKEGGRWVVVDSSFPADPDC